MKKILIVILGVLTLSGCSKREISDYYLEDFVDDVLEDIIFTSNDLTINNDTALALNLFEENDVYIDLKDLFEENNTTIKEVKNFYLNKDITDIYTGYNMCIVYDLLDLDTAKLEVYFGNTSIAYDDYSYTTLLACLEMLDVNDNLKESLELKVKSSFTDEDYNDADVISKKMMLLEDETPEIYKTMIKEYITEDGVLNPYTGANASSTASTIVGLICAGEDLNKYDVNKISLYESLLSFETDGGFMSGGELDLEFATPQAFLALACLYVYDTLQLEVELF